MKLSFHINFHTIWGQKICIVGSIPELGMWETALAKEMDYAGEGNWILSIGVAPDTELVEYRYFLRVNDQQVFEEWEKNHRITLEKQSHTYTLYDYWQTRPANIAFYSSAFTKSLFAHPCNTYERAIRSGKKLSVKISAPRVEKNQCLAITGNQECIGNWNPGKALILSCDTFPEWHIDLDAGEIRYPLEYKFIVWDTDTREPVYWESGENRTLDLPAQEKGETTYVSGLYFRENLPPWRCAGSVIPVFSLRSENSFGVGDLADLRLFIDWVKKTGQRLIQVLPVNDTTATCTWTDSYPYSAISIYALHPMYISLPWMGVLKDVRLAAVFAEKQNELNSLGEIDYERVVACKTAYCRAFFEQEGEQWLETDEFREFFSGNEEWLVPYAAYAYFRDKYQTTDFPKWGSDAVYNKARVQKLCSRGSEAWPGIAFSFFLQFVLHKQFKAVSDYARKNGIVLKGDLPIGVNRNSVEVWTAPQCFNMNGQAGAPPDDFSVSGQNWMFPTYNWEVMEKDRYRWWKKRFAKLSDYFDCFRIDHILGFFRIWEIPLDYTEGLCGHFNPALPLSKEEIEQYGLSFNESRFTTPHIHCQHFPGLFGEYAHEAEDTYLLQSSSRHFVLKPFCDTQAKIGTVFAGRTDKASQQIKSGLLYIANEVLFVRDPYQKKRFHPRISASQSFLYRELSNADRYAFDYLYWDFFYRRHNDFWKEQAYKRLAPLIVSTQMLVCGEDLGMIPDSVPEVMNKLQILSLEIERMSKTPEREFAYLPHLPYLSVCTTSTHDMPPLRNWWKEDREKTERYYNQVLQLPGEAPAECTARIAEQIIANHLGSPAMLVIIPLQDWLATDEALKREDYSAERINIPAHAAHYWRYRMHITIEELLKADTFNDRIICLIKNNGRAPAHLPVIL
ncbi:MAG: 4-alpha-glucanotransferase [Tannerellaceae bacterium]|jgi:4-alpha-glucanotransferase|nr:4-alpha-glucanotransferase [Tannerellaceae bacterium]